MADWSGLPADCQIRVFQDHLADLDALAQRLRDFAVVTCMRNWAMLVLLLSRTDGQ
jgi:hypothetical protein